MHTSENSLSFSTTVVFGIYEKARKKKFISSHFIFWDLCYVVVWRFPVLFYLLHFFLLPYVVLNIQDIKCFQPYVLWSQSDNLCVQCCLTLFIEYVMVCCVFGILGIRYLLEPLQTHLTWALPLWCPVSRKIKRGFLEKIICSPLMLLQSFMHFCFNRTILEPFLCSKDKINNIRVWNDIRMSK